MVLKTVTPYVGLLVVYIRISFSRSLKDRRQVVRSVLDRINRKWNISAIDLGPSGSRSDVVLGISGVGTTSEMVNQRLSAVFGFIERLEEDSEFEIIDRRQEVERYDEFPFTENK
jgi:uncharacterized protein YlxP (DUF503 family)